MLRSWQVTDTDPKSREVWYRLLDAKPLGQQLSDVLDLYEMAIEFHKAGLRQQYPEADEREIFLRSAAARLGTELCRKVYGWAPEA
ncbi:MAG: hypothetical protein HY820_25580 [Acidobacteria bacterium]|nr:hypothetical protein [Acidobacteriota bacterium]